jgi:predicted Rossmann fold flavoprotein
MQQYDVIIIGAGAAGLMCAIEAGKRGRRVLVLEHNSCSGEKIRISGGGRCNFTNLNVNSANYISQNPNFVKSALTRYTPSDFISLVDKYHIPYHEREHGQLFCDGSAEQLIRMLLEECRLAKVEIRTNCHVKSINKIENFQVVTDNSMLKTSSLVIATGGLSIPKTGATPFGFKIAEQFGINIIPPKPGLVPLKFSAKDFEVFKDLSGISIDAEASCNGMPFRENILITHRGLSGPAILQVSSYWKKGDPISIYLLPGIDVLNVLTVNHQSKKQLATILEQFMPSRFIKAWLVQRGGSKPMNKYSLSDLRTINKALTSWQLTPIGTEGYEKAEVTVGGIDTRELSSKTMEAKKAPGLYFIGEVVDVTGWLGGYNFHWAWSSGWASGQAV